jgi:hypothetical protein
VTRSTINLGLAAYEAPRWGGAHGPRPEPGKSFLLQDPEIELVALYTDGRREATASRTVQPTHSLGFEGSGLREIELSVSFYLTVNRQRRRVFHAVQILRPPPSSPAPTPTLVAAGWKKDTAPLSPLRTDGRLDQPLVHPLLKVSADGRQVTVNVCFVDITEVWFDLWKDVASYKRWKTFCGESPVALRFLALTLGEPLIWACAVPDQVAHQRFITPLIFYMPADFGDIALPAPSVAAIVADAHKRSPLMQFLAAPIDDDRLTDPESKRLGEPFRNVVHHDELGPRHWDIDIGLARAVGACKRPYVLMIPQRKSGGGNGLATSSLVRTMAFAAVELMRSQDVKFVRLNATPPQPTKLVLCGYSDSGVSLWSSAWTNAEHVKAVIGIEPQNLNALTNTDISGVNKRGIDLLARFATEDRALSELAKRKFFLVGRHRTNYRLELGAAKLSEEAVTGTLTRLPSPDQYDSVFSYPPRDDGTTHPFVRYRTYRLYHPTEDPLMNDTEKGHLASVLARSPGPAAASTLFPDSFNADRGSGNWYSHNFAANGGQEFTLPTRDPARSYYGVLARYKTFFQQCLESARP